MLETVTITITRRDAEFAVQHLRHLADAHAAHDAKSAAANLSARFVADQIEAAMNTDQES